MDAEAAHSLRRLLAERPVAALGTLHGGEPAVSMVPFVLPAGATAPVIHVSALAPHTRDMREHARVSLLVMDEPGSVVPVQALPRVALQCDARFLDRDAADPAELVAAREAYLARFPDAALTFDLADFSLVLLEPRAARLVAGFGRAYGLGGDALRHWLLGAPDPAADPGA